MDSYYETNGEMNSPDPVAVSPNRPPQFKESNCGFRCGWGCCEPSGDDDGGGSDSDAPTLVHEDDDRALSLPDGEHDAQQQVEMAVTHEVGDVAQPIAYVENNLHHQIVIVDAHPSLSSQYLSPDEADSSLENEPSSGSHSVVTCDGRRIEITTSDALIGIRRWIGDLPDEYPEDDQAGRAPPDTLFRVPPLRLSAQSEHCRGNPFSHMVIRDDMVLSELAHSNWSSQAFFSNRGFSRSDDFSFH